MVVTAWAALVLAATAAHPPPAPDPPPAAPAAHPPPAPDPPPAVPATQPDPELARIHDGLDALLAGAPPDGVTVAELLGGTVPDADAIEDRLRALERTLEQEPMDDTRRRILERRRQYLTRLRRAYERLPRPALRSFELLTQPRTPIRTQVAALADLETATRKLLERLETLDDLLAAGRLVGFRSELAPARRHLEAVSGGLADVHRQLDRLRVELDTLAGTQETTGRVLRGVFLVSLATDAGVETRDRLFREHLRVQRRLRHRLAGPGPSTESIATLAARVRRTFERPEAVGDVFGAEQGTAAAQERAQELVGLLGGLRNAADSWALAFERELVTLFEPMASAEAREQAQRITVEIVEEIRAEAIDGWTRVVAWARAYPSELRAFVTDWRTHGSRIAAVLALLVLAVLLGTGRLAPMRWLVQRLARWPWLRRQIRLVVRGGNLLQTVFPSLAVYVLLYATLDVIGFDRLGAQLVWVFVHWIGLYWVGRQIVLGVTRPIARGRPALIAATPETAELVRLTYARLGLIFACAFIIDDIAAGWFGAGHLRALVDLMVIGWTGAWALWAALAWRERSARAWIDLGVKGAELGFARWMRERRLGALFTVVAVLRVGLHRTVTALWWLLERTGVTTYLRAKSLRRLSREHAGETHATPGKLPDEYLREFPLSPLVGDQLGQAVSRPAVESMRGHLEAWRQNHADGSVVLIGEKGSGKTTLLALLAAGLDVEVTTHTWGRKATSESAVVRELGPLFARADARDIQALIDVARAGPERIVLLDEVHNVFLRTIDGYRGLEALVELVNGTHDRVFWVLAFNTFAWEFLNQSRGRAHHFRRLIWLDRWSADELKRLINDRNKRSGFTVEFDPVILDTDADTRDFQLVESADGFFRLLWETSGGNPRVGLYLWLQSLQMQFGSIRAKLFRQPSLEKVTGLTDDMVFVLASICQHENLSVDDLGLVLRMKPGRARFAMQFLREASIVEPKHGTDGSYTLSPRYYRQTLRFLRDRHLLFEAS